MSERENFRRALAQNEDDTVTRLAYAQWLDEQHEYEEADRQRKWPAAKAWLRQLCPENPDPDTGYYAQTYEDLLAFGQYVITHEKGTEIHLYDERFSVGDFREFFDNWSIVTGTPLPRRLKYQSFYSVCCPGEKYWIGGARPTPKAFENIPQEGEEELERVEDELAQDADPRRRKKRKD